MSVTETENETHHLLRMYHWWSLSTLYLDVSLVEFIYLVFRCTIGGVYLPRIWMYHWWSLSTLYLDVPLVEFIYLVFGCTIGGDYLPCIWMYHWRRLSTLYLDVPLVEIIYLVFGCTTGGDYLPCIWMYHWWRLSTLYLDVPLVEFIYLVFGCTIGGVYLPCIWMYHWWSLSTLYFLACQVTVTVGNSGSKLSCSGDIFLVLINSLCWHITCFSPSPGGFQFSAETWPLVSLSLFLPPQWLEVLGFEPVQIFKITSHSRGLLNLPTSPFTCTFQVK